MSNKKNNQIADFQISSNKKKSETFLKSEGQSLNKDLSVIETIT